MEPFVILVVLGSAVFHAVWNGFRTKPIDNFLMPRDQFFPCDATSREKAALRQVD